VNEKGLWNGENPEKPGGGNKEEGAKESGSHDLDWVLQHHQKLNLRSSMRRREGGVTWDRVGEGKSLERRVEPQVGRRQAVKRRRAVEAARGMRRDS